MGRGAVIRSWMLVILVLLLEEWGTRCRGCWEDERTALLQIKSSFNHLPALPYDDRHLSGWWIDTDCCTSARIRCNATTNRVTQLNLWSAVGFGYGGWYLNATLFLPFKDLTSLDLSGNQILGCIENEGFEKLSKLVHLETLSLSYNQFNGSVLSSLRDVSSLKSLDLSYNKLKGIVNIQDFSSSLKRLYLRGNQLKGPINMTELHAQNQLEELDLRENEITGFVAAGVDKSWSNCSDLSLGGIGRDAMQSLHNFFPNLRSLSLASSNLEGISFGGSYNLNNLEALYLEDSTVDDNFLQSMGALASLRNLSIDGLNSSQINQGWPHLKSLKKLVLDSTNLSESMVQTIGNFASLEYLSLSYCQLSGSMTIPQGWPHLKSLKKLVLVATNLSESMVQTIGNLASLEDLSLYDCQLSGSSMTIPEGICKLSQLQELSIFETYLAGTLPPCMANLTSLRYLDLSDNQLKGNISLSPLRALKSLESLSLSYNQFQIPVTLSPFFNHTKLDSFDARGNHIFAETEPHSLTPKFQLSELYLSGYGYGGRFPKFLYYQHNLNYVDLSHIQLSGGFPYWLLGNNTDLSHLSLANNSLSGQLWWPSHSNTSLQYLDISENCLRGHFPALIGAYLPILKHLNMSGNGFYGRIPPPLANMSSMVTLDLSNNELSGEVPGQLATGCSMLSILVLSNNSLEGHIPSSLFNSSSFMILDLSHNSLRGKLPQWTGNMYELGVLDLSDNKISGGLPSNFPSSIEQVYLSNNRLQGPLENAFYNSSNLVMLDLGSNNFTGSIPEWIGNFSNLGYLLLNNNSFEGEIPNQLCKLDELSFIDFSHNDLSGHILPCLRAGSSSEIRQIFYPQNNESKFQPHAEITTKKISYLYKGRQLSYFSGIDLSSNNFTGEIPPEFGKLSSIKVLNLSHNCLKGPIPSTFSDLKEIESLDLSYNNLTGKIPHQLTQLYQLEVFTVAHNNLSGKIPDTSQFATFDNRSYEDNPLLCGPPLNKSCDARPSPPSSSQNSGEHEDETGFINMDAFYPSFLASYSIVLLGMAAVLYINPHWRRAWFYFVGECINSCYYFIVDNLPMPSKYRAWQPCV